MLIVFGAWAIYASSWLNPIETATGGLVSQTLVANLVLLAVVLVIICGLGKLRPADVGLRWSRLGAGIAVTAATWLLMQLAGLGAALVTGTVALAPTWEQFGLLAVLGALLGQVCGNALVEEVSWRGFALPQAYWRLARGAWWRAHASWTLVGALAISQLGFALIHLPSRLVSGMTGLDLLFGLLLPGMVGVVFALVYLRTGNLFLVVGLHALYNAPTLLFANSGAPSMVMLLVVTLALLVWPRLAMREPR
jgi:membrane protease YdiL (CAAX protease family)